MASKEETREKLSFRTQPFPPPPPPLHAPLIETSHIQGLQNLANSTDLQTAGPVRSSLPGPALCPRRYVTTQHDFAPLMENSWPSAIKPFHVSPAPAALKAPFSRGRCQATYVKLSPLCSSNHKRDWKTWIQHNTRRAHKKRLWVVPVRCGGGGVFRQAVILVQCKTAHEVCPVN